MALDQENPLLSAGAPPASTFRVFSEYIVRNPSAAQEIIDDLLTAGSFYTILAMRDSARSALPITTEASLAYGEAMALSGLNEILGAATAAERVISSPELSDALGQTRFVRLSAMLGRALARAGDTARAEKVLSRTILEAKWAMRLAAPYLARVIQMRDADEALRVLDKADEAVGAPTYQSTALRQSILMLSSRPEEAIRIGEAYLLGADAEDSPDIFLAMANAAYRLGNFPAGHKYLTSYFSAHKVSSPYISADKACLLDEVAHDPATSIQSGPLVTVIMANYNCADKLHYSIESIVRQTYLNIQILIIDDNSNDDSREVIRSFSDRDQRIEVHENTENIGYHCSRNRLIPHAKGAYVTFHDSDDWHHPERIARHVRLMEKKPNLVSSQSRWVRVTEEGYFVLRFWLAMTHPHPASLFVRRHVFDEIGYFDSVRFDADSEFLNRLRLVYGTDHFELMPEPLGMGLSRCESLTQSGPGRFEDNGTSPIRYQYKAASVQWHREMLLGGMTPKLCYPLVDRPFDAPPEILP